MVLRVLFSLRSQANNCQEPLIVSPLNSESVPSGFTCVAATRKLAVPFKLVVVAVALSVKRANILIMGERSDDMSGTSVPDGERNHRLSSFAAAEVTLTSTVTKEIR